jgi:tRNA (guanine37-N1)-methyltransferase
MDDGKIDVRCVDIRDFAVNKHGQVDDYPYGGKQVGAGMVMMPQPIYGAYDSIVKSLISKRVVYMSPQGKTLSQKMARELSLLPDLCILCGHYEGVDQRVIDEIVTDEISIGDYILTGGELPALVLIDSVSRLIDGVIKSAENESFENGLLEHPLYTRPPVFMGREVPEVLINGNHKLIDEWKKKASLEVTKRKRNDLL